jgi:predicted lipoprotein with Yx(FWY)xxD motif
MTGWAIYADDSAVHPQSTREETTAMGLKKRHQDASRRLLPRATAVALTLGGLTSTVVAASAGALPPRGKSLVISTTANPRYGTILVSGTAVYTLKAASKVACGSRCRRVWPEVLLPKGVKRARAGKGTDATKLGTVKRKDGARQVTYAGKALYWFHEDNGPGRSMGT